MTEYEEVSPQTLFNEAIKELISDEYRFSFAADRFEDKKTKERMMSLAGKGIPVIHLDDSAFLDPLIRNPNFNRDGALAFCHSGEHRSYFVNRTLLMISGHVTGTSDRGVPGQHHGLSLQLHFSKLAIDLTEKGFDFEISDGNISII